MTNQSNMNGGVAAALQYAHERLVHDLDPRYRYHNAFHTFEDVMPAAVYLADAHGVDEDHRDLLRIGVAYHDIGFVQGADDHERRGVEVVSKILPGFGFPPKAIKVVAGLILATRLPQNPSTLLERIIADADLDVLGREDFAARNVLLYRESKSNGVSLSAEDWRLRQIQFLRHHRYYTQAARDHRDEGKARNLTDLINVGR